jgi:alkanesulfonate monooxygenase SsuD/methylene tetrahydromethanopterin reductase-like flavin-dependent oxidoreductase (luciferase family)
LTALFGLNLSISAAPGADPVADAVEAEGLGFDFVSANDHPNGDDPTHELWTLLTWVAAATSRIKVASRVIGAPYRNPAMLAKMAATLSEFSGGRLILGLGGGSSDEGMTAFGIESITPRAKMDALEDALRIIRGLWTTPSFTYHGAIHSVSAADVEPKPSSPIPIWLGTFGQRGLSLAGRLADGWIPSLGMAPPERAQPMRDHVMEEARTAGRRPDDVTCVYNIQFRIGEREPDPLIVSGTVDEVTRRLLGFIELGFSSMNFMPVGPEEGEQRERLAEDVLPSLRAAGLPR